MATSARQEYMEEPDVPEPHELTPDELWALFDAEARRYLGVDAHEFIRKYDRGDYDDRDDTDVMSLAMLLPLVRQEPARG